MENILAIDWRVLAIQTVGFVFLLGVFKFFLFTPLQGVMRTRQEDIAATYDAAESEKAKSESLRVEYEHRLSSIEAEAREKINTAIKEGQTARDDILLEARAKAEDVMRRGEEELVRERDKAMFEIREEVVGIAIRAASKLIERSLDEAAHHKLVASFIDGLEARK